MELVLTGRPWGVAVRGVAGLEFDCGVGESQGGEDVEFVLELGDELAGAPAGNVDEVDFGVHDCKVEDKRGARVAIALAEYLATVVL